MNEVKEKDVVVIKDDASTPTGRQSESDTTAQGYNTTTNLKEPTADEYPQGISFALLSLASLVSIFLIALDQTIIGTAIPKITDEFQGLKDVSWYGAAYFMTFGAAQTSAGKMYRYFNLKWSFLLSLLVFEVGSLICGVAPNSKTLVVGRAIAGLGGAGMNVGGTSLISFTVPPKKRPMMMGVLAMTYCISAVLGPILGGVFTDKVTWRWCFYINLPIGGVASAVIFFFFKIPANAKPQEATLKVKLLNLDPVGFIMAMAAITCFILALQYGGNAHPWNSSVVIGLFVGFGLIIIALVAWEIWMGDYGMMMPRLYKSRSLRTASPFQFFYMGSYIVLLFYLPTYFQSIRGDSPIQSGVHNLPLVLAAGVFAIVGGVIVTITGRAHLVMFSGSIVATVAMGLIYTLDLDTSTAKWAGYQILVGSALAFAIMHGITVAQAYAKPEDLSAVTSNVMFWQVLGGAFSTAAGQSAFVNQLVAALKIHAPDVDPVKVLFTGASEIQNSFPVDVLPGVLESYMIGLKATFAVAIGFSGVAFLFSMTLPWEKLPTHGSGEASMAMA